MLIFGIVHGWADTLLPGLRLDQLQQIREPLLYIVINCSETTLNL